MRSVRGQVHPTRAAARCAGRTVRLLLERRLHLHRDRVGSTVVVPGGRPFTLFRESSCDDRGDGEEVTLLVWFHLKGTTPRARWRSWVFERESILNTLLYAGFEGYRRKLWLVDRTTADYAGLYAWVGRDAAEDYARYITAVLRPLSTAGSVGSTVVDGPLTQALAAGRPSGAPPAAP
jgi:hypothetical protein